MNNTWIQTLTFALVLAGCSSESDPGDKPQPNEPSDGTDAGNTPKRDAAPPKKDTGETAPDGERSDADATVEESPPEDGKQDAAAKDGSAPTDAGHTTEPRVDAASAPNTNVDPKCAPMVGPGGFDPSMPPPGIIPDNIVSMADGVIFTTGGGVYKVPGQGRVFGRMEDGSCIVTVAETGVSTTVLGDGDVCINGHLVASKGKCLVDSEGDSISP